MDMNLYELTAAESSRIPEMCSSLCQALKALEADHQFLLEGGVFTKELLMAYIELKKQEALRLSMTTHPVEFDMYYAL